MARKLPKSKIIEQLRQAAASDDAAVEFLEQYRWQGSPECPHCQSENVYRMKSRKGSRNKDRRWRCRDCNKQFSVRTGTVFEESRLPLRVWCHAFWRASASKKGISAKQIERECQISYKSALFLMHRVRWAMADLDPSPLGGTVEVDETYVGGKPRYPKKRKDQRHTGRGTKKTPVVALVERGGNVRLRVMERVTAMKLGRAMLEHVQHDARVITDDWPAYKYVGTMFKGGHETVKHSKREYVRPGTDVHSNTVEGVFSLLKRGVMGTFHSVSKHHLHRYLAEFEFRHNHRFVDDGQRTVRAIWSAVGKRLMYSDSSLPPAKRSA